MASIRFIVSVTYWIMLPEGHFGSVLLPSNRIKISRSCEAVNSDENCPANCKMEAASNYFDFEELAMHNTFNKLPALSCVILCVFSQFMLRLLWDMQRVLRLQLFDGGIFMGLNLHFIRSHRVSAFLKFYFENKNFDFYFVKGVEALLFNTTKYTISTVIIHAVDAHKNITAINSFRFLLLATISSEVLVTAASAYVVPKLLF